MIKNMEVIIKCYTPDGVKVATRIPSFLFGRETEARCKHHAERLLIDYPYIERISFRFDKKEYSIEPNKEWEVKEL